MQLVAYGAQDVYLTGNPQITYFKIVYRRHTNFSIETTDLPFNETADFGRRASVWVTRTGDLVTNMFLRITLPEVSIPEGTPDHLKNHSRFAWVRRLGHALISSVNIEIGGTIIDTQCGGWLEIWDQLVSWPHQDRGYAKMIGDVSELTRLDARRAADPVFTGTTGADIIKDEYILYIPLQFWFNRHSGLAIPLVSLQYHKAYIHVTFNDLDKLCVYTGNFVNRKVLSLVDATLLVDYVYLDTIERKRFARVGHEYLIEQVQFDQEELIISAVNTANNVNKSTYTIPFMHPIKELYWCAKNGDFINNRAFLAYSHIDNPNSSEFTWKQAIDEAAINMVYGALLLEETEINAIANGTIPHGGGAFPCPIPPDQATQITALGRQQIYGLKQDIITPANCFPGFRDILVGTHTITVVGTATNGVATTTSQPLFAIGEANLGGATPAGTLNLYTKIQSADIAYDVGNKTVTVTNVIHTLTLRDISRALFRWTTDNRNAWVKGKKDIYINQHHNCGLLLDSTSSPIRDVKIINNGHDRFERREGPFFNYVQPWQHHTFTPRDGYNTYSFALHPQEHQPSGTSNFSRIDIVEINLTFSDSTISSLDTGLIYEHDFLKSDPVLLIHAINYNVLRVMNGLGGIAYTE